MHMKQSLPDAVGIDSVSAKIILEFQLITLFFNIIKVVADWELIVKIIKYHLYISYTRIFLMHIKPQ